MDFLSKLERTVLRWLKDIPHLPEGARKWLGNNVWWMAIILLVFVALDALGSFLTILPGSGDSRYVLPAFAAWQMLVATINLIFALVGVVILSLAINPLKLKQKKGWVLLFVLWLVEVVSIVVHAVLTLSVFTFITYILFGAIWLVITGYFLFEIHGQFAHTEKSRGIKEAKTTKA